MLKHCEQYIVSKLLLSNLVSKSFEEFISSAIADVGKHAIIKTVLRRKLIVLNLSDFCFIWLYPPIRNIYCPNLYYHISKSRGVMRLVNGELWMWWLQFFIIRQSLLNELFNKIAHKDQRVLNSRHLYALNFFVKPNIPARTPRILARTTRQQLNSFSHRCRVCCSFCYGYNIVSTVYHICIMVASHFGIICFPAAS